jgi:hypothetical protein
MSRLLNHKQRHRMMKAGVLDKQFGRRCAVCNGTGRVPGIRAALRLNRAKRRLQGIE